MMGGTVILLIRQVCRTHIADTSGNGCIDANELFAFIDLWKQNQAAIGELMEAIGLWKQGCA